MLSIIKSSGVRGIDGYPVDVEVDLSSGLPTFKIGGLPDLAINESKERVKNAINSSGYIFPIKHITVNLAPADTKKEGTGFDLPIALGILRGSSYLQSDELLEYLVIGELSFDGSIKPVSGILSMVDNAFNMGIKKCFVPFDNRDEAGLISGMEVFPAKTLKDIVKHLDTNKKIEPYAVDIDSLFANTQNYKNLDYSHVKGQELGKRALEIVAAGGHNFLMVGPPGSGKTMLSQRLPTILPDLTFKESLELTKIYSVSGVTQGNVSLITSRPFRSPHHTISASALTGGGRIPKPGEISLSHHGILFLDELPEFQRNALEVMRQPLEDKVVTISRVQGTLTFPSNFMLLSAMNPCPCGYLGSGNQCTCSANDIGKYQRKISGPLLDRIDIMIEIPVVTYEDLQSSSTGETSETIKARVVTAHKIQLKRYADLDICFNAQLSAPQIDEFCKLDDEGNSLLEQASQRINFSGRTYHKILKVARTIADLDGKENIEARHVGEAIQYRSLDRKFMM